MKLSISTIQIDNTENCNYSTRRLQVPIFSSYVSIIVISTCLQVICRTILRWLQYLLYELRCNGSQLWNSLRWYVQIVGNFTYFSPHCIGVISILLVFCAAPLAAVERVYCRRNFSQFYFRWLRPLLLLIGFDFFVRAMIYRSFVGTVGQSEW